SRSRPPVRRRTGIESCARRARESSGRVAGLTGDEESARARRRSGGAMRTRSRGLRASAAALAAASLLVAVFATPAGAITHGSLDGSGHPYVGLMTAHAAGGQYLWRCSGTLISPTVFVTAGHCVEADASQGFGPPTYAVVFFKNTLITPDPVFTLTTRSCTGIAGYPCGGANETAITG